jgi:hypothetical protein
MKYPFGPSRLPTATTPSPTFKSAIFAGERLRMMRVFTVVTICRLVSSSVFTVTVDPETAVISPAMCSIPAIWLR